MNNASARSKRHNRMVGLCLALALHAVRHPWRALSIVVAATLIAGAGTSRLKLRTDGHALVDPHAPQVLYDQAIRDQFGIDDQVVVLIRSNHPDGIFNPHTIQLVRELTASLSEIPGVNPSHVVSLATEPGFRLRPTTMIQQKLLEPPLKTRPELDRLREDLDRIELYTGTLVAFDGRSTVILVGAPAGEDRTRLYEDVLDRIAAFGGVPEKIDVTGAPVAEALLGLHILEDLGVPEALLGASTRPQGDSTDWKMPTSLYGLRRLIVRRVGLIPVAVAVMMLAFFVSFRNVVATLLPLPVVLATLVFVFGLMGWLGVPVYLTTAVMPVLLTAMCVTDEIHLFSRYFAELRKQNGGGHIESIERILNELASPVVNTTLTTAIGFLSFGFSPLAPVRTFGIFTAVGMLFCLICTLTIVPALLALLPPAHLVSYRRKQSTTGEARLSAWFARGARMVVRYRGLVLVLMLTLLVLVPLGMRRLTIQDSWINGFDPDSKFRQATQVVNEQYHGMHLLLVAADAPEVLAIDLPVSSISPGQIVLPADVIGDPALILGSPVHMATNQPATDGVGEGERSVPTWNTHVEMISQAGDSIIVRLPVGTTLPNLSSTGTLHLELSARSHFRPELIRSLGEFAAFVREHRSDAVGGVLGPADYLSTTRFMSRPDDPDGRALPKDAMETKLMWEFYRVARGPERLHQMVDPNYWKSLTTIFLKDANFVDTARLMADIRDYERKHLNPRGIHLGFAGDVAVSQSLIKSIVITQLRSLCWALAGIYAVTALLGRSLRWGFYCVLPSTLAVLINFAVMGWLNIPLGVATSIFAGMTLGLGVDFAIHLLAGYGQARSKGLPIEGSIEHSLAFAGPAVLINTLSVAFGFGVLMLSQVPSNARLGMLLVLGLVNCLLATIFLLPVLLRWWPLNVLSADGERE